MLILDSAKSRLAEEVKDKSKTFKDCFYSWIVHKITAALNISVNKSFKINLKIFWGDWIINGYYTFIKDRNMKKFLY